MLAVTVSEVGSEVGLALISYATVGNLALRQHTHTFLLEGASKIFCLSQLLRFDYMSDKCMYMNARHKDKSVVDVLDPPR